MLIYGGAALGDVPEERADRSIREALDAGINHFDTAADYGDSELHLGRWMPEIRHRIFLATKTGDRTAAGAYASVRRSLERLRVDHVDLIQIHAVGDPEDLDRATGRGGALEGLVRARDEGLAGAIGITGHGMQAPATHRAALDRFPFDTVLTPYNHRLAREERYRRDFDELARAVTDADAALLVIKAIARNLWPETPQPPPYATWYEPFDGATAVDAAVSYVLDRPEVTGLCTAGDTGLLALLVRAERNRQPAPDADRVLSRLDGYEPPFVRTPGRSVPDWLHV